jgi:endonuclease-3
MTSKKLLERKTRLAKLDRALKKLFPHAKTELNFKTPWQMMVAVQLSAQCTDKQVNKITKELFKKYKKLEDYLAADPVEFEQLVHSCTYAHNKTRNILAAANVVKEKFKGKLPKTMDEMLTIPGVGRKTANVVLGEVYGVCEGITVDTHVIRFVNRFDLSDHKKGCGQNRAGSHADRPQKRVAAHHAPDYLLWPLHGAGPRSRYIQRSSC